MAPGTSTVSAPDGSSGSPTGWATRRSSLRAVGAQVVGQVQPKKWSSVALAVVFQRDHQESEMVWPHNGQVCCRSPSRQSLNTAVHFGQRAGGVLTGTVDGAGPASRTQILLALGSC